MDFTTSKTKKQLKSIDTVISVTQANQMDGVDSTAVTPAPTPAASSNISPMVFVPKGDGQKKINSLFGRKAGTAAPSAPSVPPSEVPVATTTTTPVKRKVPEPAEAAEPEPEQQPKPKKVKTEPPASPVKPKKSSKEIDISGDDDTAAPPVVVKKEKVKKEVDPEDTDDDESKQEKKPVVKKEKEKVKKEPKAEEEEPPKATKKKNRTKRITDDDEEPEAGELDDLANQEKAALKMLAAIQAKSAAAKAVKDDALADLASKRIKSKANAPDEDDDGDEEEEKPKAAKKKKKAKKSKKGERFIDAEAGNSDDDDDDGGEKMTAKQKKRELKKQKDFVAEEDDGRVINPAAIEEAQSESEDEEEDSDEDMEGTESDAEAEELANHVKERANGIVEGSKKPKAAKKEGSKGKDKDKKGTKKKEKKGSGKKGKGKGKPCIICFDTIPEGWQTARGSNGRSWLYFHPKKCWSQYMANPTKDWSKPADDKKAADAKKEKDALATKEKEKKAKADSDSKAKATAVAAKPAGATAPKKGVLEVNEKGGENKRPLPKAIPKAELIKRMKEVRASWHECMESTYKEIGAETDKKIIDTYPASLTALVRDAEAVEEWRKACDKCKTKEERPDAPELFSTKDYGTAAMLYYGISCSAGWGLMEGLIDKAYE